MKQLKNTFRLHAAIASLVALVNLACVAAQLPNQVGDAPKLLSFPLGERVSLPSSQPSVQDIEPRQVPSVAIPSPSNYPIIQSQSPNPNPNPAGPPPNTTTSTTIPLYGQTTTTPTYSVNLTPFGGSLIPSVPNSEFSSVRITTSSTAGFPALTGYPVCGKFAIFSIKT